MQLGIHTGLFYDADILESLPHIRATGFETVEVWAGPQRSGEYVHFDWHDGSRVRALGERLRSLGLAVHSLHAPFSDALDVCSLNEVQRRFAVAEIVRTMEALKTLGGRYLVVHPASNERSMCDRDAHFGQSRKSLEELARYAGTLDVLLAVENQLPHILGGDAATLLSLLEGLPPERVGICFDTSHANLVRGMSLEDQAARYAPRLMTLHVSDNYGRFDDHFVPGDGQIDWPSFIAALQRHGYGGVFMLEVVAEVRQNDKKLVLKSGYQRATQLLGALPNGAGKRVSE